MSSNSLSPIPRHLCRRSIIANSGMKLKKTHQDLEKHLNLIPEQKLPKLSSHVNKCNLLVELLNRNENKDSPDPNTSVNYSRRCDSFSNDIQRSHANISPDSIKISRKSLWRTKSFSMDKRDCPLLPSICIKNPSDTSSSGSHIRNCVNSDIKANQDQTTIHLVRIKQSTRGQSVPNLSSSCKDFTFSGVSLNSHDRLTSDISRFSSPGRRSLIIFSPKQQNLATKTITNTDAKGSPKFLNRLSLFGIRTYEYAENSVVRNSYQSPLASPVSPGYGPSSPETNYLSSQSSLKENKIGNKQSSGITSQWDKVFTQHNLTKENQVLANNFSPSIKQRSHSINSPCRSSGVYEQDIFILNQVYKERFPKATIQMKSRLCSMLLQLEEENTVSWEPISRLVHTQIMKHVKDILNMTNLEAITSAYFFELTQNLETLLQETRLKCLESLGRVLPIIQNLLFIISRPARLLECIEFNPKEFYELLEFAENNLRNTQTNVPKYIISQLGLDKNPDDIVSEELNASLEISYSVDAHKTYVNQEEDQANTFTYKESNNQKENSLVASFLKSLAPTKSDFEDIKLISNGAYGAVHLVRENRTKKRFAMKKIRKGNLLLHNQVQQIFGERDIMTFADSPFVVGLFCTFETRKHLCMVMEYVAGGDVATLIQSIGPLPYDLTRLYFAETVLALEYLHYFGIVHRDLKPDNLLITSEGHIKLTDFGLSKVGLMNLTTTLLESILFKGCTMFQDKQIFGTPNYIAPEVILRQGYDRMIDWWAMGIILYEFVIGCTPFYGDSTEELFNNIISGDIEWPEEPDQVIPENTTNLITELLKRDPLDRIGLEGTHEVKEHEFFSELDWNGLLRQKALFVPVIANEEDTSYFDSRTSRYQHESKNDDCEVKEDIETVDNCCSENSHDSGTVFKAFSSCSRRFSRFIESEFSSMTESNLSNFTQENEETEKMSRSITMGPSPFSSESSTEEAIETLNTHVNSTSNHKLSAFECCVPELSSRNDSEFLNTSNFTSQANSTPTCTTEANKSSQVNASPTLTRSIKTLRDPI